MLHSCITNTILTRVRAHTHTHTHTHTHVHTSYTHTKKNFHSTGTRTYNITIFMMIEPVIMYEKQVPYLILYRPMHIVQIVWGNTSYQHQIQYFCHRSPLHWPHSLWSIRLIVTFVTMKIMRGGSGGGGGMHGLPGRPSQPFYPGSINKKTWITIENNRDRWHINIHIQNEFNKTLSVTNVHIIEK